MHKTVPRSPSAIWNSIMFLRILETFRYCPLAFLPRSILPILSGRFFPVSTQNRANTRTAAPKSALGKAFTYLKEQWPYLTNYLKDGRLELSNNRAERSIKPFVIDRKNFLFANTPKGATGSAIMYSMIQTAIENGLEPYRYLTWLLKTANNADLKDPNIVESLLPWNAPEKCIAYTR